MQRSEAAARLSHLHDRDAAAHVARRARLKRRIGLSAAAVCVVVAALAWWLPPRGPSRQEFDRDLAAFIGPRLAVRDCIQYGSLGGIRWCTWSMRWHVLPVRTWHERVQMHAQLVVAQPIVIDERRTLRPSEVVEIDGDATSVRDDAGWHVAFQMRQGADVVAAAQAKP